MVRTPLRRTILKVAASLPVAATAAIATAASHSEQPTFASIRRAPVKPGSAPDLAKRVPEVILPVLRSLPGFVSFQMIYGDGDVVTAITVYKSEAAARQANDKVIPVVREVFGPLLAGPLEPSAGMVIASATA